MRGNSAQPAVDQTSAVTGATQSFATEELVSNNCYI